MGNNYFFRKIPTDGIKPGGLSIGLFATTGRKNEPILGAY